MRGRKGKGRTVLIYSLVFLACVTAEFWPFLLGHRSFIWKMDGQGQYYPYLVYTGRYLRKCIAALIGRGSFPGWYNAAIGLGAGIDTVIWFHPLDMLSVFVPESGTEILYNLLVIMRLYLAGSSFLWLCHRRHISARGAIAGSVVYLFSGYAMVLGIRHPFFLTAMIMLPLLIAAADRALSEGAYLRFALVIGAGFFSNYYFNAINSVILAGYVGFRLLRKSETHRGSRLVKLGVSYAGGTGLAAVYLVPSALAIGESLRSSSGLGSIGFRWAYAAALLAAVIVAERFGKISGIGRRFLVAGMAACLAAALALMCGGSYLMYSPERGGSLAEFQESGEAEKASEMPVHLSEGADDGEFYRMDLSELPDGSENGALLNGYFGTSIYNSLINRNVAEWYMTMDNPGLDAVLRYDGTGRSAIAAALTNVKYAVTADGDRAVPYGFERIGKLKNSEYVIWENENVLSFGYSYGSYMLREDFEKLTPAEKQLVMISSVVTEEAVAGLSEGKASGESIEEEISDVESEHVTFTEEGFAAEDQAYIHVSYEKRRGYECYLYLQGFYGEEKEALISYQDGRKNGVLRLPGLNANYGLGKTDYMFCLNDEGLSGSGELFLWPETVGKYYLAKASLVYVPVSGLHGAVRELSEDSAGEFSFSSGRLSCRADMSEDKVMVFSIPYSEGWTATVDGEKQAVLKANVGFCGLSLTAGEHEIVMRYRPRGLVPGLWISVGCAAVMLVLAVRGRRGHTKDA